MNTIPEWTPKVKHPLTFTTPDYVVPSRLKSKSQGAKDISEEEVMAVHAKFVVFREGLRKLGFLPEGANESDEVAFTPASDSPSRAMNYRATTVTRYFNSGNGVAARTNQWGYTQAAPELMLFQANLLRPVVFGFSPVNSFLFKQAFHVFLDEQYAKSNNNSAQLATCLSAGLSYKHTLQLLKHVKKITLAELKKRDIEPTNENMIRAIILQRFIERGHSYMKSVVIGEDNKNSEQLNDFIFELIRHDVRLYHALVALSPEANAQLDPFGHSATVSAYSQDFVAPKLSAAEIAELNEIPEHFIQRVLAPRLP